MVKVKYCDNARKVDLGVCSVSCELMDFIERKLNELDDLVQCAYYIELESCLKKDSNCRLYFLYDEIVDFNTFKSFLSVFSLY